MPREAYPAAGSDRRATHGPNLPHEAQSARAASAMMLQVRRVMLQVSVAKPQVGVIRPIVLGHASHSRVRRKGARGRTDVSPGGGGPWSPPALKSAAVARSEKRLEVPYETTWRQTESDIHIDISVGNTR